MAETLFKFLYLPSVTIGHVLQCCNPFELIVFSHCSKRSANLVKLSGTRKKKMSLDFSTRMVEYGKYRVYLWPQRFGVDYSGYPTRRFGTHVVPIRPIEEGRTTMEAFWNGPLEGMMVVGMLCATIFGCKIKEFLAMGDINYFRTIINFIMAKQTEIDRLKITSDALTEQELHRIREQLNITEELWIDADRLRGFRYTVREQEPKMLRFEHSQWFTLDQLLATKSVRIFLSRSCLSNLDLDVYIRKWKDGDYPNLVSLEVQAGELNNEDPIAGVVPPIVGTMERKSRLIGTYYSASVVNGIEVVSNDGRSRAVMRMDLTAETNQFSFLVYT